MNKQRKSRRLVIQTYDAMCMLGVGERSARNIIRSIRKHFQKDAKQVVSIQDFAEVTGIPAEDVAAYINGEGK